jgi:hypothetical protein
VHQGPSQGSGDASAFKLDRVRRIRTPEHGHLTLASQQLRTIDSRQLPDRCGPTLLPADPSHRAPGTGHRAPPGEVDVGAFRPADERPLHRHLGCH